ncbi:MAG: hypothetical protein JWR67_2960, partial [Mucilaginibacter sp.]|nr:hypothetical protein [Mucilaginibacter sp.]
LSVQDNGIPFSNDFQHKGIGLITIKDKIKLLNGKFSIWSDGKLKLISIRIPNLEK